MVGVLQLSFTESQVNNIPPHLGIPLPPLIYLLHTMPPPLIPSYFLLLQNIPRYHWLLATIAWLTLQCPLCQILLHPSFKLVACHKPAMIIEKGFQPKDILMLQGFSCQQKNRHSQTLLVTFLILSSNMMHCVEMEHQKIT